MKIDTLKRFAITLEKVTVDNDYISDDERAEKALKSAYQQFLFELKQDLKGIE